MKSNVDKYNLGFDKLSEAIHKFLKLAQEQGMPVKRIVVQTHPDGGHERTTVHSRRKPTHK